MQNTSSTSQTNANSSSSTQPDLQTREAAEILCGLSKQRPADSQNSGPKTERSSSRSSAPAKKLGNQSKQRESGSKRPAASQTAGPSKKAKIQKQAKRPKSSEPTEKQVPEIVKDILDSPNLDGFFSKLSSYKKDTVNFWDIFFNVIKQKVERYLEQSRDNNSDEPYKLKEGNKKEFSTFISKFNSILEITKFPPTEPTIFISFILSPNTNSKTTSFEKYCNTSKNEALKRATMENSCKETTDQVHNFAVLTTKAQLRQINQFNIVINIIGNCFNSEILNSLNQIIKFKNFPHYAPCHSIINFQYHATLFTGIRHLTRRCIESVDEKLSKGAENNYAFRIKDHEQFVSHVMSTLNKKEIIGKELPNPQEFIKYILSEDSAENFKTFIYSKCQGCDIVSEFKQINEKLKNRESPTEQYTKSLDFLTLDEFGDFLQCKRTNRLDKAPFVTEIWDQYSSLKQNIARHELYKNKEFKKFVLDQVQIDGNIYGPENQKKIVVTLLKNINNPDRNNQEKTKLLDSLKTYLKVCYSLDLSQTQITDTNLKVIANLCPHLQSLDLSGCEEITDLSPLSELTSLTSLDLSRCHQITNEVLGVIAKSCPKLKSINLTSCKEITDLSSLSKLNSLQSLDLFDCFNITDLSPLSKLKSLQSLNLSHCRQITNLSPLSKLKNLNSLSLHGCKQIANLSPLSELISLQSLNLSDCLNITDLSHLSKLKNLNSLSLYGCNQITNAGIEALGELTRLQSLYLNGCSQITNLSPLAGCTNLKSLDLSGCNQITNAGIEALGGLTSLQSLKLFNCHQITNDSIQVLGGLTNLQSLNLSHCRQITNAGMNTLAELPNLKSLDISGCDQITDAGVSELRTTLPALSIQR